MLKRALISVYNKDGILELAQFLVKNQVEIISTGGTYKYLKEHAVPVKEVSEITHFPEILDGRVKTLHPKIHGGILAIRNNPKHVHELISNEVIPIDLVVVNLYPFFAMVNKKELSFQEKIEFIDIGGPSMLRSAAKNFQDVIVLSDPIDYSLVIQELDGSQDLGLEKRQYLAAKVFNLTAAYDAAVNNFLAPENLFPNYLNLSYQKAVDLRYGENPNQIAAFYTACTQDGVLKDFIQLSGKELSFNNLRDMDIAWRVVSEFNAIASCGVKHNTPCAVALGDTVLDAYTKMKNADSVSIFGGIVALNSRIDYDTAKRMNDIFLEVIMAPDFSSDALELLSKKKNLRLIKIATFTPQNKIEYISVDGGVLAQSVDNIKPQEYRVVTNKRPTNIEYEDMLFARLVVKYVKSNAIVVVKNKITFGISGGQTNRVAAVKEALDRALACCDELGVNQDDLVLASDAFFPFSDSIEICAKNKLNAIIQPGGSVKDQEVIEAADLHQIAMVFSGVRNFKH